MSEPARHLDDAIDGAALEVARLLQADALTHEPMRNAPVARGRLLERIVDLQIADLESGRGRARSARRASRFGRRVLVHGMVALIACGATAAVAQTDTAPGEAVREAANEVAGVLHLPPPARRQHAEGRGAQHRPVGDKPGVRGPRAAKLQEARQARIARRQQLLQDRREQLAGEQADSFDATPVPAPQPTGDAPLPKPPPTDGGTAPSGSEPVPVRPPGPAPQPGSPYPSKPSPDGTAPAPAPAPG